MSDHENPSGGDKSVTGEAAFLLTRDWRDTSSGIELDLWAKTATDAVRITITGERAVCFVEREASVPLTQGERRAIDLKSPDGAAVDALYFNSQADLKNFVSPPPIPPRSLFETDVRPVDRFLMERFIEGPVLIKGIVSDHGKFRRFINPRLSPTDFRPSLSVASLDIETDYTNDTLLSIGVSSKNDECVFLKATDFDPDSSESPRVVICQTESSLLTALFDWVERTDPDVLIGWNVIGFDLKIIEKRCQSLNLPFRLGRGGARAHIIPARSQSQLDIARVPGRVVMDGIESLRAAFYTFENFSLERVANELLGRGKLIDKPAGNSHAGEEILRLYRDDPTALVRYNIEDCRLVSEIFEKTELVEFSIERAASTGLSLGRVGGSVAAFDFLYLPRLHRNGFVAPDPPLAGASGLSSPGGYVLDSRPGLYNDVLVLDFKSLYPSIIRTFLIDPAALWKPGDNRVEGFDGASFHRDGTILPGLIDRLWERRDAARRLGNTALSQAVKIIMNSFYGVLGTSACRFYDNRLTSSITRRGHQIIQQSQQLIEDEGLNVIYGDTDSLFVWLSGNPDESQARATGEDLADMLNRVMKQRIRDEHGLTSYLEIEFETHYLKFLMPTIRGSGAGSKKRYAGLVRTTDGGTNMIFKGLETVRSDWTQLAREFQHELFRRIFLGEPFEGYVRETHEKLYRGELDTQLIYRKQLRQDLDRYRKNIPPHAQAARKLASPGRHIEYVICKSGPEPVKGTDLTAAEFNLDYDHYSERQLKPVADTILLAIGSSFDEIVGGQFEIFSTSAVTDQST
ncbi:MAG: DNA polymerase [marine bacterium B5-7]|nr:MAG: DNA polymerase [marine bacterium B5-7]